MTFSAVLATVAAIARHPSLWWTAIVQARRLTPRGWWRRRPFLPVPDAAYVRFRLVTMYGDENRPIEPADLITYLRWCRTYSHVARQGSGDRPIAPAHAAAAEK